MAGIGVINRYSAAAIPGHEDKCNQIPMSLWVPKQQSRQLTDYRHEQK